jgi:hypothetical protein
MPQPYQIRADYDASTIVVYQAYPPAIALPALAAKRFVPPFSLHRMTWIKPSFLWLMERSNWGRRAGHEHTLAVRITRSGWEEALSLAVLTHPEPRLYPDPGGGRRSSPRRRSTSSGTPSAPCGEPAWTTTASRWG